MNRPESVTQVHLTGDTLPAIRPDAAKSNKPSQEIPVAHRNEPRRARSRAQTFAINALIRDEQTAVTNLQWKSGSTQMEGAGLFHAQRQLALFSDPPGAIGAGIDTAQRLQGFGHVRGHGGLDGARFRIIGNDAQPMSQFAFLETMQCHA